jgi:hypothetical protein
VTIILVFDGADLIKLTPFDKDINDLHKRYAREFKEARSPFVTLLAARKGAVFDYTINYPGTVVVPATADPLPPPETNRTPLVASTPAPPPVIVNPPVEPATPPHVLEITLSGSNFMHKASAPPPADANVTAVVTPPPAVVVPPVVSNAPPPAVVEPAAAQAVNTNVAPPESAPASSAAAPAPPLPARDDSPAIPPRVAPMPAPAPPFAVATATSTGVQVAMFIAAFSLLTIAVVLVLFLVRRARGGSQPSLISQSIDRSK